MKKQWIVVFTLAHSFHVFRTIEKPDSKILRYASIVFDATEVNDEFVLKDRYGIFNPGIHPIVSNSYLHMVIAGILGEASVGGVFNLDKLRD